jgi:hypothetical protein
MARSQGFAAAFGAGAALISALSYWGFSVDDALISARVAHHLHDGAGYRFNRAGPVVDAVTPLGWAFLLAPFAKTPLAALQAARLLGVACFLAVGAVLGQQMAKLGSTAWRFSPLLILALCAPLGAWAVAGMETALVITLCTVAVLDTPLAPYALFAAVFARPELLPWAFALQLGFALSGPRRPVQVLGRAALPWLAIALAASLRFIVFGRAAPLAVLAKPAAWDDGVRYLFGALLLSGPPWLLLGRINRLEPRFRVLIVAGAVHFLAVGMAGGDWMPFFRLVTPVLPGLLLAAAALAEQSTRLANGLRLTTAGLVCIAALVTHAAPARGVMEQRLQLVQALGDFVQRDEPIITLDVGWVGAATPATVRDLSGVTDPELAGLSGGHTSKRLAEDFLERCLARSGSAVLVLLVAPDAELRAPWYEIPFDRVVEQRLARQARKLELAAESFEWLALQGTRKHYIAVRLRPVR